MSGMSILLRFRLWVVTIICPEYTTAESELRKLYDEVAQLEATLKKIADMPTSQHIIYAINAAKKALGGWRSNSSNIVINIKNG